MQNEINPMQKLKFFNLLMDNVQLGKDKQEKETSKLKFADELSKASSSNDVATSAALLAHAENTNDDELEKTICPECNKEMPDVVYREGAKRKMCKDCYDKLVQSKRKVDLGKFSPEPVVNWNRVKSAYGAD